MSLQTVLRGPSYPLIIFQSSAAQSSLAILGSLLRKTSMHIIICSLLYSTGFLIGEPAQDRIQEVDCTTDIPGYEDDPVGCRERLFSAIHSVNASQPLTVVIDSLDTLLSNLSSKAAVCALLGDLQRILWTRSTSRLIIHAHTPSASSLVSLLTTSAFSPSLAHIIAHPPPVLTHLATHLSTPPPPLSSPEKFWNVFLPVATRTYDAEELVFGSNGEGGSAEEIVVELVLRGGDSTERVIARRKGGVERTLEGWTQDADCELKDLASLRSLFTSKPASKEASKIPDPTQNLSFNLTLTPEQQQSRTQVPLPYAHTGAAPVPAQQTGAIFYDPDSADDIDDDDPDEDLDI